MPDTVQTFLARTRLRLPASALVRPGLPALLSALLLSLVLARPEPGCARDAVFDADAVPVGTVSLDAVPVGGILAWPAAGDPASSAVWLDCDGRVVSATDYPDLVAALTGSTSAVSAVIPDLRGLFLRGYGTKTFSQHNGSVTGVTETTYASGELGAVQGDAMRELYGTLPLGGRKSDGTSLNSNLSGIFGTTGRGTAPGPGTAGSTLCLQAFFSSARAVPTADEFRPANMAVRYLIRAH